MMDGISHGRQHWLTSRLILFGYLSASKPVGHILTELLCILQFMHYCIADLEMENNRLNIEKSKSDFIKERRI